jgi:hypothetical protein
MPYTLNVVFRGPMVFVPSAPIDQPQPWFGAFLVNADQQSLDDLGSDRTLKVHFPYVRYNVADLKGAPAGIDGQALWKLAGEDVVIRPATSPGGPLTVAHSPTGTVGTVPAGGDEAYFDWVPKLGDLLPSGDIHVDCLQNPPTLTNAVARVHLFEGSLEANTLSNFSQDYVIMEFIHLLQGGNKIRQVIATSVALRMTGLTGDLTLRARTFDGTTTRQLVLAQPANGVLDLEILNLCADEILDPPPLQFPGLDADFAWNYLITAAGNSRLVNNTPLRLPLAVQFEPGQDGGGEFAKCTHPQAAPIAAADLTTMQTVSSF